MTTDQFLTYVASTRSPEVLAACQKRLAETPDADRFMVLHQATVENPEHVADVGTAKYLATRRITTAFRRKESSATK